MICIDQSLERSGLFDEVCFYSRTGECLYPVGREGVTAGIALQEILFGLWTSEEERHCAFLREKLAALRE